MLVVIFFSRIVADNMVVQVYSSETSAGNPMGHAATVPPDQIFSTISAGLLKAVCLQWHQYHCHAVTSANQDNVKVEPSPPVTHT